jgi:peptide methionine sulfoxide reductase MsrB
LRTDLIENYEKVPNLENINNHSANTNSENVLESDSNYSRYNKHETPFPNNYHQKTNRALYEKSIVDYLKYSSNSTYETQQQQQTQQPLLSSRTSKNKSGGKEYF